MRRGTWFTTFAASSATLGLPAQTREALARLDDDLFALWNLGDNVLLAWTRAAGELLVLSVRHYAIPEAVHAQGGKVITARDAPAFVDQILSGPKYLAPAEFARACQAFGAEAARVPLAAGVDSPELAELVSDMVRCYGVSLVRDRAVVLLDAVSFSLRSPLDQVAMLNSLSYSVNSAYAQLLSKDIRIDFARTTTGDGFYIWNRATTPGANVELYKLMMMMLADNAVARAKARNPWVPRLRAAFHVGEHYEFHQVEGLNPTNFTYIVGQVTVDLARMLEQALPGQILLGDFVTSLEGSPGPGGAFLDTCDFVESTAATLDQLNGLDISGGRIKQIRCYLTGRSLDGGRYLVNRYHLRDKHSTTRMVYNAKINIHRDGAEPIYLGIQNEELWEFNATRIEALGARVAPA